MRAVRVEVRPFEIPFSGMDRSIGRHPNDQALDNWKLRIAKSEINHIENDRVMFLMSLFVSIKCSHFFGKEMALSGCNNGREVYLSGNGIIRCIENLLIEGYRISPNTFGLVDFLKIDS